MKIHIVMHEGFESPAALESWAHRHQHTVSYSRVYQYESLPQSDAFDFLIVMGGPQSPDTTKAECDYFDAAAEIALIKSAVADHKFVLGICLGAQLLGEACGAHFEHSPHKEIGVFPIHLTEAARQDPILATFPHSFLVGHWHGDMPGLNDTATVLAESAGCPRQIVRYTPKAYGFQCHLELTSDAIQDMIDHSQSELAVCAGLPYVQSPAVLLQQDYDVINQSLFTFLDQWFR